MSRSKSTGLGAGRIAAPRSPGRGARSVVRPSPTAGDSGARGSPAYALAGPRAFLKRVAIDRRRSVVRLCRATHSW